MTKKQKLGPNQLKWIRALETTKLRQATGALCKKTGKNYSYCCLGIAERVIGNRSPSRDYHMMAKGVLSKSTMDALKMHDERGDANRISYSSCINMNDRLDFSFKDIAARLRKDPERYFKEPA